MDRQLPNGVPNEFYPLEPVIELLFDLYIVIEKIEETLNDFSKVFLNVLETEDVKIPIAVYVKKERYSVPQLEITTQNSINFEFKHLIQRGFNITINNKEILGDSVDIESIFYGTQYGKKTIK